MIRSAFGLLAAAAMLLTGACSEPTEQEGPLVLAAASLQGALSEAADSWAAQGHPRPIVSFAATSALARQIEAGAPADVFISADEAWMNDVSARGLIQDETRSPFLSNRLVLIAPADSNVDLEITHDFALAEMLGNGRLALADPDIVPAGRYAKQALISLGVWPSIATKVVPAENVRVALALVARREAALGIVYATDARAEPGVKIVGTFPEDSHTPITYPLAILKSSRHVDAPAFRNFLLSAKAKAVFGRHGFEAGRTLRR